MKRVLLTNVVLGFLAASVAAQHPPGGSPDRGLADRSGWFGAMLNRVANQLGLDESQREQFDEIAARHRQRMQGMGQRWQELRQAMRDGDEERAAVLRAELESTRGPAGPFGGLLADIEPLLRDDQLERLHTMQDQMQERRRHAEMYRRVTTELPEELGLDEAQREQWDQILASRREQRREQWEDMRTIWQDMRAAEEAGDQERLEELRKQLEDMRPDPDRVVSRFLDQLEDVLRDDQLVILDRYRQEFGIAAPEGSRQPGDVRTIIRAAKRVRLGSEQREALKRIERDAAKARREIDRRDAKARERLAATVKRQIIEMLDPEQTREFEEHLKRLDRRYRRSRDNEPERKP